MLRHVGHGQEMLGKLNFCSSFVQGGSKFPQLSLLCGKHAVKPHFKEKVNVCVSILWIRTESRELHLGFGAAAGGEFCKNVRAYFTPVERSFIIHKVYEIKERLGVIRDNQGGTLSHQWSKCGGCQMSTKTNITCTALGGRGPGGEKAICLFWPEWWLWRGPALAAFLASDDSDRAAFAAYLWTSCGQVVRGWVQTSCKALLLQQKIRQIGKICIWQGKNVLSTISLF